MKSIGDELGDTVSEVSLQFSWILYELHGGAFSIALLMFGDLHVCVMQSTQG